MELLEAAGTIQKDERQIREAQQERRWSRQKPETMSGIRQHEKTPVEDHTGKQLYKQAAENGIPIDQQGRNVEYCPCFLCVSIKTKDINAFLT